MGLYMNNSFSNYYLISNNTRDIIKFCKKIYDQFLTFDNKHVRYNKINLSISNLYFMFNTNLIIPYVNRYNINYIPSYRIDTVDDNSLIIMNPKSVGMQVLKDLELERSFRLSLIIDRLFCNNIIINIDNLTDYKQLHEIDELDISTEVFRELQKNNLNKYNTIISVYENVVKKYFDEVPLNKYSTSYITDILENETIILANPTSKNLNLFNDNNISGIIQNFETPIDIIDLAKQNNLDILPGTGELI